MVIINLFAVRDNAQTAVSATSHIMAVKTSDTSACRIAQTVAVSGNSAQTAEFFQMFLTAQIPIRKHIRSGLLNLLCGVGNFYKIWSAYEQHEFQFTKRRMNKYT
jgi:hypothetical protein